LKDYNKGDVTFNWEYWVSYELYRHEFYRDIDICSRTGKIKFIGESQAENSNNTQWNVRFEKKM